MKKKKRKEKRVEMGTLQRHVAMSLWFSRPLTIGLASCDVMEML